MECVFSDPRSSSQEASRLRSILYDFFQHEENVSPEVAKAHFRHPEEEYSGCFFHENEILQFLEQHTSGELVCFGSTTEIYGEEHEAPCYIGLLTVDTFRQRFALELLGSFTDRYSGGGFDIGWSTMPMTYRCDLLSLLSNEAPTMDLQMIYTRHNDIFTFTADGITLQSTDDNVIVANVTELSETPFRTALAAGLNLSEALRTFLSLPGMTREIFQKLQSCSEEAQTVLAAAATSAPEILAGFSRSLTSHAQNCCRH